MDIKLFSDLIDALGKVVGSFKTITNLPKTEREHYRQAIEETFRLIDTTLNMVIIRLGDIQLEQADPDFLNEIVKLDNWNEWYQAEREFRLCRSLRVAVREAENVAGKLRGMVSAKDWDAALDIMRAVLAGERDVAAFVVAQFQELATDARATISQSQSAQAIRAQVTAFRDALNAERRRLIRLESDLYDIV